MKQPKRLTREQKKIVSGNNLNVNDWMFVEDLGSYIVVQNKTNRATKRITKYIGKLR